MLMGDIFFAMLTTLFTAPLASFLWIPANIIGGLLSELVSTVLGAA
jgi:hypothetical protein